MARSKQLPQVNLVDFYRYQDDELASALAGAIAESVERTPKLKLNDHHLAILTWSAAAYNVPNGGFTQFFYNHGDKGVSQLAELLDKLELSKPAKALRDAVVIYKQHKNEFKVSNPWDGLFGSIKEFGPHEKVFYKDLKTLNRELDTWTREHIGELATDEAGAEIDAQFTGTAKTFYPSGKPRQTLEVKKGKPHGSYYEYFEGGSVRDSQYYKSGKISRDFYPNGQPKCKESKKGDLNIVEWFYPDGTLQKRYVKNKEGHVVEPIRAYHPNGQLAEEMNFVKDKKRGPWLKFFEDGKPQLEAKYVGDESLVVRNAWDEKRKQVVKDGKGIYSEGADIDSSYSVYSEPTFRDVIELKDGIPHGKTQTYFHDVLWGEDHYVNGKQSGESITYWDNGRVRTITKIVRGKAGKSQDFPKFDNPVPAVLLTLEANDDDYDAWRMMRLDKYPSPLNLKQVQKELKIPEFLKAVYQRNVEGVLQSDYEDWNSFDDGIAYFLTVNAKGEVTLAMPNGSGVYSGGEWNTYRPLLMKLRFSPGSIQGEAVECRVLAWVTHTFIEGAKKK